MCIKIIVEWFNNECLYLFDENRNKEYKEYKSPPINKIIEEEPKIIIDEKDNGWDIL